MLNTSNKRTTYFSQTPQTNKQTIYNTTPLSVTSCLAVVMFCLCLCLWSNYLCAASHTHCLQYQTVWWAKR